jgi:CBS domain containing-hemolysin-like protein
MTDVLLIVASLLLVVLCGVFVSVEFSLLAVNRAAVESNAGAGDRASKGVVTELRSLSTQLSAAQVGITVTTLAIGLLTERPVERLLGSPLVSLGVPQSAATALAFGLALVGASAVTMVFGELIPKNLAIAQPLATARRGQRFQRAFTSLIGPLLRVLNGSANLVLRRLGIEPQEEMSTAREPEELASLVRRSAAEGALASATALRVERSLSLRTRLAVDVLTPRRRMVSIRASAMLSDVLALSRQTGFSRFPVLDDRGDNVVGLVHIKHAVTVERSRRSMTAVSDVMLEPLFVPTIVELDGLLDFLRDANLQAALVVDEFGTVAGLVTLEDLLEELVGEVRDEHDRADERISACGPGVWELSGLLRPDEIAALIGVVLPDAPGYETLAGLVIERLGRLPRVGDEVRVDDAELVVERMDGPRLDLVRLSVDARHADDDAHMAPGEPT